jgi:hypothetical protein
VGWIDGMASLAGEFDDAFFDLAPGGLPGLEFELAAAVGDGGKDAAGASVADSSLGEGKEEVIDEVGEGVSGGVGDSVGKSAPVGAELSTGEPGRGDAAAVGLEAWMMGVMVAAIAGVVECGRLALASVVEKIDADSDHE